MRGVQPHPNDQEGRYTLLVVEFLSTESHKVVDMVFARVMQIVLRNFLQLHLP